MFFQNLLHLVTQGLDMRIGCAGTNQKIVRQCGHIRHLEQLVDWPFLSSSALAASKATLWCHHWHILSFLKILQ